MSEIRVNSVKGVGATSAAITISNTDGTCAVNNTQRQGKNLVVNGSMLCSQRGSSFTSVGNNDITIDRFGLLHPYSNHFNVSHSTDAPDGFSKSYKLEIANTDSAIGTGQYVAIRHKIEAQHLQQLAFGTSSAKNISLSFYVKSNQTGTYAVNIQQTDNSSKQVSAPYTINSANTWERKTFTFAGDTSGVINDDNGTGLSILWWLSAGSTYNSGTSRSTFTAFADADSAVGCNVNILGSTSNNFFLTGVQLETSDAASDFEFLTYAQELTLCQRYYYMFAPYTGYNGRSGSYSGICENASFYTATNLFAQIYFPTTMRTSPSLNYATGTNYYIVYWHGTSMHFGDSVTMEGVTSDNFACINRNNTPSSASAGASALWRCSNDNAFMAADADL